MNLKCNSCSERTSHVGRLILLWERGPLCSSASSSAKGTLSAERRMPTQGVDSFSRLFHQAEESQEMPCLHVPMSVAEAYPSFSSHSTQAFMGELCVGCVVDLWLLDPARCSVHHSFAWTFGADPLRSWSCLGIPGVAVWHSPSGPSPLVVCPGCWKELLWERAYVHVLFLFLWNYQVNLGMIIIWTLLNGEKKKPICSTKRQCKEQALWLNKFTSV